MELQDTRFMRFMMHFWANPERYKGASRVCAVFINFFLLLFKLVFCGVLLLILAPHMAANALLNKTRSNILQKILYVMFVVICLVLDIPLLILCAMSVVLTFVFLANGQLLEAMIFAFVSWAMVRITKPLVTTIFCRVENEQIDEDDKDEQEEEQEEEVTWTEREDDIDDLVFCQLFTLGEDMCLLIDHIEMCPDETAFIRVVSEETYTPIYKRKVRRDKQGNRFIIFNSTNYYLDDKKTQPIITIK